MWKQPTQREMLNPMAKGLIDLHSHILPGLDDGAASIVESGKMFEWYVNMGVASVVATPHFEMDPADGWQTKFNQSLKAVQHLATTYGIHVRAGAEVRLTPNISRELLHPIDGTDFVLVDFPSGTWPFYAEDALFRLQTMGFRPILAHPERYGWQSEALNRARALGERGVVLQVTLASLNGMFGKAVRQAALDLLEDGVVHVLATDAHGAGARLESAETSLSWINREHGDVIVDKLLRNNPSLILEGRDPEPVIIPKSARRTLRGGFQRSVRRNWK